MPPRPHERAERVVRRRRAVRVDAQDLAVERVAVLSEAALAGLSHTRVELAVGSERDPAAVVNRAVADAGDDRIELAAELEAGDPVVADGREVRVDELVG